MQIRRLVGLGIGAVLLVAAAGAGVEAAEGPPEDFRISGPGATASDREPAVAWNAIANEYLVVWSDGRNIDAGRAGDIYGQRMSAAGSMIEANFLISGPGATGGDWSPAVAWNGLANEYMVVWEDGRNRSTRGADIYGQRVSALGARVGANFRVSGRAATADEQFPALAWDNIADQYLVVWEDGRNDPTRDGDLYAQLVDADGARVGGDLRISGPSGTSGEWSPAVAWNLTAHEYLVVWQDGRNYSSRRADVYGQRVSAAGSRVESNFRISGPGATSDDYHPAVAWNNINNQYLVAWSDGRNEATRGTDIQAQLVSATGFLAGSNFRVNGADATADDDYPAVSWNGTTRQFLVVWQDGRSYPTRGTDIYGQRVLATGSRIGPDFMVSGPEATSDEEDAAVVWNRTANQYLVAWHDFRRFSTRSTDIYGQRVAG